MREAGAVDSVMVVVVPVAVMLVNVDQFVSATLFL